MVHAGVLDGGAPRPTPPGDVHSLLRWICTSNPFYALSAVLFLAGLRLSVEAQPEAVQSLVLMAGLAAYTLLLAGTAWLLVRFAGVWDDVRTLLLLVVLLFLATSVTFDEALVLNPERGRVYFLAGLLFAIVVSEALLRGLGLKLPVSFRVPYYLALGLFFLYPLLLQPLLADPRGEALQWGLFGFSTAAGLVFLTLLPAIRQTHRRLTPDACPWLWPHYPWALFAILAIAVPGRAMLLCWSMQLLGSSRPELLVFGPYFLVPFGLALAVLVLEAGLVSRGSVVLALALTLPVGLAILAGVGHREDQVYQDFLTLFHGRLGCDPLFATLALGAAFYAYATLRRAPGAVDALTAALLVLAVVPPDVLTYPRPRVPALEPLLAAGLLQLAVGLARRNSVRGFAGLSAMVAGAILSLPADGVLLYHLIAAGLLLVGILFRDRLGRSLLVAGLALVVLSCLAGLGSGYWALRQLVPGLDYLAGSLALFAVAVLISLAKGGRLSRDRPTVEGMPASAK
jgi:hypothetical protein